MSKDVKVRMWKVSKERFEKRLSLMGDAYEKIYGKKKRIPLTKVLDELSKEPFFNERDLPRLAKRRGKL